MKNRIFLILILIVTSFLAIGQESTSPGFTYFNSFHAGGLFGKKGVGSGASFSTVHGVRIKRFALGIGVGYDSYQEWQTLPVFVSVSRDFLSLRDNAFFIQLTAGSSTAWSALREEGQFVYDEDQGLFFHPLLGYRIHTEKINLYFTAGYKFQRINYEQTPRWWIWGFPGSKMSVERDVERLSVQVGFGFH